MKIAFTTLGCKVNQFDTAVMSEEVSKENHQVVSCDETADLYIINTCTVTDNADLESRHWVKKARQKNPKAKIVVTGCYAQTNPAEVQKIPGVQLILGNEEKKKISSYLSFVQQENDLVDILRAPSEPISCVGEIAKEKIFRQPFIESFLDKTRAFLKVQDGCNSWCSFCIIPRARGRSRSFSIDEIIAQIQLFEEKGYREVVFSGINLGSYGLDFSPKSSLLSLLKEVEKRSHTIRFRFSSIEPDLFTEELIGAFSASSRVCRHFHIPLQSGDQEILKKMNRKYTPDQYRMTIERIHRQMPEASIGVDVMVGFPGETNKEFQNTVQLLTELPISYLHVFPFSVRELTEAAGFSNQVSFKEKKERARQLRELGKLKGAEFKTKFLGKPLNVLIEEFNEDDPQKEIRGLSDNYLKVIIKEEGSLKPNEYVEVIPYYLQDDHLLSKLI